MDEQTAFSPLPVLLCNVCEKLITEQDRDSSHTHHDLESCKWIPELDEEPIAIMIHDILCDHQLHFHQDCCPKCTGKLVGV